MKNLLASRTLATALAAASAALFQPACTDDSGSSGADSSGGSASGGSGGSESGAYPSTTAAVCPSEERIGSFVASLAEDYTNVRGAVSSGVAPSGIPEILAEAESCTLFGPRELFCSTPCENLVEVCAGDDVCVPAPEKQSAGTVTVTGLAEALTIDPNGITFDYSETFSDPFPGFDEGAEITLTADGGDFGAFRLSGTGVAPLTSTMSEVPVESGTASAISWEAGGASDAEIRIKLTVNTHGGTTGWIECTTSDSGSFEIPAELVTSLMELGFSGFPRVALSRRTVESVDLSSGCVDFTVSSEITLPVSIPGLTSCSEDTDCPDGETCQEDLSCGA